MPDNITRIDLPWQARYIKARLKKKLGRDYIRAGRPIY
jgi:hypothetical protein